MAPRVLNRRATVGEHSEGLHTEIHPEDRIRAGH
jgi:hypothetical protein